MDNTAVASKKEKLLGWAADKANLDTELLEAVLQREFSSLLILPEFLEKYSHMLSTRIDLFVKIQDQDDLRVILESSDYAKQITAAVITDENLIDQIRENGFQVGFLHCVDHKSGLEKARDLAAKADFLFLAFKDATNIPLELLVAENQNRDCRIIKMVQDRDDADVSLQTMEHGCDGVILNNSDLKTISEISTIFNISRQEQLELTAAAVVSVTHTGMGDRVCIDTTSELTADEGMLLGSTSHGGLVVCSETHFLPYMELRPFRVNAGGIHMYLWGPDHKTSYLSELRAGSRIWVVNSKGRTRQVTVGRVKRERRPLLLIEAVVREQRINTFIQDDWHVRVMGADGSIIPSSEIKIGDSLLAYQDRPGRHVGIKVDETITEI